MHFHMESVIYEVIIFFTSDLFIFFPPNANWIFFPAILIEILLPIVCIYKYITYSFCLGKE